MEDWQKYKRSSKVVWTTDGQFPSIEPHTKVKHQLLESYLSDWVATITGNCRFGAQQVTLVDGFCGGGIYRDGNSTWEGSPIRIIRAIESGWKSVQERKPYQKLDIAYLFVDRRKEHTDCLKQQIRDHGYGHLLDSGIIQVKSGHFEDHLGECLQWIKSRGGYSFFFLDPFGSVDLPGMSKAILSLGRSEVLLNHMQNDAFVRPIVQAFKNGRGESYLRQYNLGEAYSFCADYDNLPNLQRQTLSQNAALELYRKQSNPRFAWTFAFMKNRDTVYYYLIHLSNQPTAVSVMRRNLWLYNNLDYQFHYGVFGLGYRTIEDFSSNLKLLDINTRNNQACRDRLTEQLDRFLHKTNNLAFKQIYEGTVDFHPATREDCMSVIHQGMLDGLWEIERDGKYIGSSQLTNRDIVRPSKTQQLVLLPDYASGRISPKRQVGSRSSVAQMKPSHFGQMNILETDI
ncbi:three-Cys-motif partner protein TcmP [Nodosilinea sp. FACHB-131]|uniref:three-Cys-motif partner protein TcmP n=1 Tax=Cyanophyceae TaxID=3028117 RepID=UPI0016830F1E|nr:three-Cys-motif partner protein TcmP [Nodosilinea sp. FACHB-131]MBD1874344.1 three-Cys-motif partner protein TcmP [Nodosilinea sp. FACHB-131]